MAVEEEEKVPEAGKGANAISPLEVSRRKWMSVD